jgi:hypothetical protein
MARRALETTRLATEVAPAHRFFGSRRLRELKDERERQFTQCSYAALKVMAGLVPAIHGVIHVEHFKDILIDILIIPKLYLIPTTL